jgi:hypothetical protein
MLLSIAPLIIKNFKVKELKTKGVALSKVEGLIPMLGTSRAGEKRMRKPKYKSPLDIYSTPIVRG